MTSQNALGTNTLTQVALVVRDVVAVRAKWAALLGVPEPPLVDAGEYATTQTTYHGQPGPAVGCTMAFFDVAPGVQLELIQPNGVPSAWQDFLDQHGEGVHHVAFGVTDTSRRLEALTAEFGWPVLQRGRYGDGSGEYAYVGASPDLKVDIETLESY
ncbi:MAG: VOC family protein [Bifidobacteriaceae bacterium]|jgi:catechol 2,3-dioxygenase-like lactoylglutathione lyase family enzyme|nr:VOC family protein [Bifidobacteriaceae bacterium]